jgi:hypothetical protein
MKKTSKPLPKTPAKKTSAAKQSAPKPKVKPASKPMPRKAQSQAELLPVLERLTQSADKLAQAADRLAQAAERLAEAARRPSPIGKQEGEALGTPQDLASDLPGSEEHPELADQGDLTTSEKRVQEDSAPDFTVPGAYPAILDPPKDK